MYDVIVVGGGHAGCEAALASSKRGHKTLLITGNIKNIATMPCNPSIGGSAKGIVVREIAALGGAMGEIADETHIQIKMLNSSKGPAVQALRAQADKILYPKKMLEKLERQSNLDIKEAIIEDLIIEDKKIIGVITESEEKYYSKAVILTTGTYLKSDILIGNSRTRSGPNDEKPSIHLSDKLRDYGFEIIRLKTGTPQRIERSSIDFSKCKREDGDQKLLSFSINKIPNYDINNQEPCYITYTTEETHQIIKENLNKSSMYGGLDDIKGIGPRYCPSIEDKIVRFCDKERHQLFLEPESRYYDDIYLQGFSTSMPKDIQEKMVHSLPGLENAIIKKYAYAIEYDAINPLQIKASLETKVIENLFTAGQINGTSGYEEAAAQGLMAGINATLKLEEKEPFILKRTDAYIGVLIDDLVTKGTKEPYRLLTSRAEYRLILRHDNADLRLSEYAYSLNMISEEEYQILVKKKKDIENLIEELKLIKINTSGTKAYDFLKRPEIKISDLKEFLKNNYSDAVLEQTEIFIKYEGYIKKTNKDAERMIKLEYKKIPTSINYDAIPNIASEARQKLKKVMPNSLGQAMRISGVNPSDIAVLSVYMRKYFNE